MLDEIEVDLECAQAMRHGPGGDTAGGHIQRDVPRVIYPGALGEADLADDLRPEVQGRESVGPLLQRQGWPRLFAICGHLHVRDSPLAVLSVPSGRTDPALAPREESTAAKRTIGDPRANHNQTPQCAPFSRTCAMVFAFCGPGRVSRLLPSSRWP